MRVSFYVPRPSSMLVANLLGVAGLVAIVVAIGLLASFAWALGAAGVIAVVVCAIAQNAGAAAEGSVAPAGASSGPPLKSVS